MRRTFSALKKPPIQQVSSPRAVASRTAASPVRPTCWSANRIGLVADEDEHVGGSGDLAVRADDALEDVDFGGAHQDGPRTGVRSEGATARVHRIEQRRSDRFAIECAPRMAPGNGGEPVRGACVQVASGIARGGRVGHSDPLGRRFVGFYPACVACRRTRGHAVCSALPRALQRRGRVTRKECDGSPAVLLRPVPESGYRPGNVGHHLRRLGLPDAVPHHLLRDRARGHGRPAG